MIRIVATDVDGTVVKESAGSINPEYYEVIRKLHKQGIQVVIASGRPYSSLFALFAPVADIVWFIADGGAAYQTTDELHAVGEIPQDWVKEVWQDIHEIPGMDVLYCCKDVAYAPDEQSEMYLCVRDEYKMNVRSTGGWDCIPNEPTSKISLYRSEDVEHYAEQSFIPKWSEKLRIVTAGEWWIDCLMPAVHKGATLQMLMDLHGYTREELMASGDNLNDFQMIEMAGVGLAVSTAKDEVKRIADRIIPNFEDDGVLQEWKKLLTNDN